MNKTITPSIRRAICAIIRNGRNNNQVLIIQKIRRQDVQNSEIEPEWDFAKGGMKDGETEEQTLWRELEEELGTKNFNLIGIMPFNIEFTFPTGMNQIYSGQKTSLFLLEFKGKFEELKPDSSEIGKVKFVELDDLKKYIKFKETLDVIEKIRKLGLL